MLWAMLAAFGALCAALIIEKKRLLISRRKLHTVIHVNGIRGKTTVCRMLDAVLRTRHRVLTKTTGTTPRILHADGRDLPLRRLGSASIGEQGRALRMAAREGAEIAILECMAVRPALQRVSEEALLKADIAIITNVRYDHILEMGDSLEAIADALSGVIPRQGALYTADSQFFPFFLEKTSGRNSRAVLCGPAEGEDANESIVRAVARDLGLSEEEIAQGLSRVRADPGMERLLAVPGSGGPFPFLNLFAANDPQSAMERLLPHLNQYESLRFVYNHRLDRPDRLLLFARRFFPSFPGAEVFLLGDAYPLAKRLLKRHAPSLTLHRAKGWRTLLSTPPGTLLVGLGNTRGEALCMLSALRDGKERPL